MYLLLRPTGAGGGVAKGAAAPPAFSVGYCLNTMTWGKKVLLKYILVTPYVKHPSLMHYEHTMCYDIVLYRVRINPKHT